VASVRRLSCPTVLVLRVVVISLLVPDDGTSLCLLEWRLVLLRVVVVSRGDGSTDSRLHYSSQQDEFRECCTDTHLLRGLECEAQDYVRGNSRGVTPLSSPIQRHLSCRTMHTVPLDGRADERLIHYISMKTDVVSHVSESTR
jgi:hypothetical protein